MDLRSLIPKKNHVDILSLNFHLSRKYYSLKYCRSAFG